MITLSFSIVGALAWDVGALMAVMKKRDLKDRLVKERARVSL